MTNGNELTNNTSTISYSKYGDWFTDEIMEYVRGASSESNALHNLKQIIQSYERRRTAYERRKTAWECFKQFLKKL